jgi:hypothetical protein
MYFSFINYKYRGALHLEKIEPIKPGERPNEVQDQVLFKSLLEIYNLSKKRAFLAATLLDFSP